MALVGHDRGYPPLLGYPHASEAPWRPLLDRIPRARLVAFGEVHETPWAVGLARDLLARACQGGLGWAGFEYFNTSQQGLLDSWASGRVGWRGLVEEYTRGPEGFNLEVYRPLLEAARACGARLVALMPPRPQANLVARQGRLPERAPGGVEADPDAWPGYRGELEPLFPREGPMARIPVERLLLAQSFKDSVAASRVAWALSRWGRGFIVMGWAHVELPGAVVDRALASLGLRGGDAVIVSARRGAPSRVAAALRGRRRSPSLAGVAVGP
ncbi:MAG: ChaN family lipoprotein [Desulfurococcales archaeon]|nr:ChaN family lipoprotein [Desulfurococcales archaeon]